MSLYTRLGDSGKTMLFGGGEMLKSDPRIHAYGTVDELNALIGLIVADGCPHMLRETLTVIQHTLYITGADLATPMAHEGKALRVTQQQVEELEQRIDAFETRVPPLRHFILPGGSRCGARLHIARTVCRRAERWLVTLVDRGEEINFAALRYLNRLGDFFFAAARVVNAEEGTEEVKAGG